MNRPLSTVILKALVVMIVVIGLPCPAMATIAGATDLEIGNYTLVSSKRISRTVYEYTYRADVSNWGEREASITATLASAVAGTTVMEGDISFGNVGVGETSTSADTFTIQQDRSKPFDEFGLVWTTQVTPLPLTTFELIEQALADGSIDDETALVYKVYSEFNDSRLPTGYLGRDDGEFEAVALDDAEERFSTLSTVNQGILAPFLAPYDVSGVNLHAASATSSVKSSAAANSARTTSAATAAAAATATATATVWAGKWVVQNELAIFWDENDVTGEAEADLVVSTILNAVWPKLTALFGHPGQNNYVSLFLGQGNRSHSSSEYCTINPQVTIASGHRYTKEVYSHELTHALLYYQFPTTRNSRCNQGGEFKWMHEATAKWAEHYVDPLRNMEHEAAARFLNEPALQLEYFSAVTKRHYGAYLWFLFLTEGDSSSTVNARTQRVPQTWAATAAQDPLAAANSTATCSAGTGLRKCWPEFVLYDWNRDPAGGKPYRDYFKWDRLKHMARESTTAVPANGQQVPKVVTLGGTIYKGFPLLHRINHLGAKYWHFDFSRDDTIRRVRVLHPYADGSEPTASVQIVVKSRSRGWLPAEPWTGYERKTLCRDRSATEDFDELVVIISDSEFINKIHVLDDSGANGSPPRTFVEVTALGCSNWIGEVNFNTAISGSSEHLAESGKATNVRLEMAFDRFSAQGFNLAGGTVDWSHTGDYTAPDGDYCSGDSTGSYSLNRPYDGYSWIAEFGATGLTTPPLAPVYNMRGLELGATSPDDYTCQDAQDPFGTYTDSPIAGGHYFWLDFGSMFLSATSPGLYDSDPAGALLAGNSVVRDTIPTIYGGLRTRAYGWIFKKNGTFNGEPDL